MFTVNREQALNRCDWKGGKNGGLALQYVEAWQYDGESQADGTNFEVGSLSSEAELKAWLARTDGPSKRQGNDRASGSIRLLVCDRTQYVPLDFGMSRQAFEMIDGAFVLSPLTMISFESESGTYCRFVVRSEHGSKLHRIQTILKVPQKREIFNWGLSLSHDVESSTTLGFLYGTDLNPQGASTKHDRYQQGGCLPFDAFLRSIQAAIAFWGHPMLLPCLFLSEHLSCINAFCTKGTVLTETVQIEHALGVTKVGQSQYLLNGSKGSSLLLHSNGHQVQRMGSTSVLSGETQRIPSREEMERLTVRINTQSTRVAFTARSPEWNLACSHFVLKTLDELDAEPDLTQAKGRLECQQLLEHNITLAEAAASNVATIKERMALQLNVLYQFVAQLDNQTSAELAASASRDSTSMKILAFISALFLPGSFIATVFSMDLIDWAASGESAILSDKFYIYWATALPLTALTIAGWAAWWYFELRQFSSKIEGLRTRKAANTDIKQGL